MKDYECHVTAEANENNRDKLEHIGKLYNWKTSFVNGDPDLGKGNRFFFTKHYPTLIAAEDYTDELASALVAYGCKVIRQKIELIIADTNNGTWHK